MYKLRLLNFYVPLHEKRRSNVHISGGLECLPDELSYLRWDCFPSKSLPPFSAEKLVVLDLKHSLVEKLWDGMQDLVNLKSLYLDGCKHLIELPDLSLASKLEEMHLDDCTSLLHVPASILSLDSLCVLNMRGCKALRYIQHDKQSRSLNKWLNLIGCSRLVKYSVVSEKLEYLNLDGTAIDELPSLVIGLDCNSHLLDCPPAIFDSSSSISYWFRLYDNCLNLSELPYNLGLLSKLNKLSIRGSNIENLPSSIKYLPQLRDLNVSNCRRLCSLPELPFLLQDLNASNCISLETISSLEIIILQDSFHRLKKRTFLRQIQEEEKMSIRHCDYLGRFKFRNCIKLDQIARMTVMKEALIRIQLAAHLSSKMEECYDPLCQTDEVSVNFDSEDFVYISRPFYSILPGNKMPDWFTIEKQTPLS